jgi:hypothetical protein
LLANPPVRPPPGKANGLAKKTNNSATLFNAWVLIPGIALLCWFHHELANNVENDGSIKSLLEFSRIAGSPKKMQSSSALTK